MFEEMQNVYLTIVLAPLAGSILAGLFGKTIGRTASHWVTILGVAVYDSALSAATIQGNYIAFVPEPGSFALLSLGLFGLALSRRRRI